MLALGLTCLLAVGAQWLGPAPIPNPRRIVSLAPSATEVLCALGACDRLVGVTRYDDFPVQVTRLPKIGGFIDANIEAVAALHPDLVVGVITGGNRRQAESLARLGMPIVLVPCDSLDDVWASFATLGAAVQKSPAAHAAVETVRAALAVATVYPAGRRAAVVLVVGRKPLVVAGPGTFLDTLLVMAGGTNAITTGPAYPVLDLEALAKRDPDGVVDAASPDEGDGQAFWQNAMFLRAVRLGHVARFDDPALLRPGPRVAQGLSRLAAAIAPYTAATAPP